jgi:hypothetical protein
LKHGVFGISTQETSMKFLINGIVTNMNRIPFTDGGYFLQILLTSSEVEGLHRRLVEALKQRRRDGGVMGVEKFKPHENRAGMSEIRVLGGLELEVIDHCRLLGYGVEQMYDDPTDTTSSN